jgi:hypothetical protein
MARSIAQIQDALIAAKTADGTLSGLTSSSNVSIWLLWTYIVAVCQWTLENLFDAHKSEVTSIIATQKPHSLQWYVTMAKAFQFGITLPADTDVYPVVPPASPAVLIVQYAAAVELVNLVRLKVARLSGGVLAPLTAPELTALTAYIGRVKDAGVRLQVTSDIPDNLQLKVVVFYDPLVLNANGSRLDGASATPVKDGINAFLDNLPFNGLFVLNNLIAALQAIDGVRIAEIVSAQANYGMTAYVPVTYEYLPDAGYMVLDSTYFDTNVTYTAHGPI